MIPKLNGFGIDFNSRIFLQKNNNASTIFDNEMVNTSQNHNKKTKTEEYINYLSPFLIDFRH